MAWAVQGSILFRLGEWRTPGLVVDVVVHDAGAAGGLDADGGVGVAEALVVGHLAAALLLQHDAPVALVDLVLGDHRQPLRLEVDACVAPHHKDSQRRSIISGDGFVFLIISLIQFFSCTISVALFVHDIF